MKKIECLLIVTLALGAAGVGCNKANHVKVVTTTMPTAPVLLKLDWPVGRHGVQTMDMKMDNVMTIPGMPQPMNQEMNLGQQSALTVLQEPNGGKRDLQLEFQSEKMSITMAGKQSMNYDSTTSAANDTNPAAATFGKLIGAKVVFVLDDSNHVDSVQGVEDLEQRLASANDPNGMMKSMFSGDGLKRQVDFAQFLPDKPVQPGDTWAVQIDYPMGPMGTMVMNYNFTLAGWEKHHDRWCAKIDMQGTVQSKAGETPAGVNGMKMNFHDGTCSDESFFDLDMGMFVDRVMYQDMKMDMSMPNPMGRRNPSASKTWNIQGTMHQVITTKFELK